MPKVSNKIVVLFDGGAQATCISKKLAKRLHLEDIDYEQVTFAGFGNRNPQTSLFAKDDEQVLEKFKENITKNNGRYQVPWPWKESRIKLNNNFGLCFGRLSLLRSLSKRPQNDERLFLKYDETIRDQLQSGIIEKVCPEMDQVGIIHYLSHHEVITPNKATTKIRIVYEHPHTKKEKKV
uniref:Protein R52.2, putative n=1 Tax=Brugia malayi TaxID=6279 RepID=A8P7H9_BRUMA